MVGGSDDDIFTGGAGRDSIASGDGTDFFVFSKVAESGVGAGNRDVITDFLSGNDRLNVEAIDADTSTAADDAFTFIGEANFSGAGGEMRFFKNATLGITVIALDVDGGGADMQIELTGLIDVTGVGFRL
eukprot:gene61261-biopygen44468